MVNRFYVNKALITLFIIVLFSCKMHAQQNYLAALEDRSLRIDTVYWINTANSLAFDSLHTWQKWQSAENFMFGKDRGNLRMITDLNALHPYFRDKMLLLIQNCKTKGIEISVVESFRTKAKQAEYFGMGRKYTRSIGGKSKHQYGLACDVVPIVNDTASWDNKELWKKIGVEGERLGLRWGGRWRTPYDPAHFEWTDGVTTAQLVSGTFPTPKTTHYPCLDEDIKTLRKFWEAWENEQAAISRSKQVQALASSQHP
jgi:hypothetical protein